MRPKFRNCNPVIRKSLLKATYIEGTVMSNNILITNIRFYKWPDLIESWSIPGRRWSDSMDHRIIV